MQLKQVDLPLLNILIPKIQLLYKVLWNVSSETILAVFIFDVLKQQCTPHKYLTIYNVIGTTYRINIRISTKGLEYLLTKYIVQNWQSSIFSSWYIAEVYLLHPDTYTNVIDLSLSDISKYFSSPKKGTFTIFRVK